MKDTDDVDLLDSVDALVKIIRRQRGEITALKMDLDSARRQLKRQYEELKKYRGDKV